MTTYGPGNPPPEREPAGHVCDPDIDHDHDPVTDYERLRMDLLMFGNAYVRDGKRVPPEDVVVLTFGLPEPRTTIRSQEELLTDLDELLDNAQHEDTCFINPADTVCGCIIGRIRTILPPCGAVYRPANPQRGDRIVMCLRNAHPSSPDRHVF